MNAVSVMSYGFAPANDMGVEELFEPIAHFPNVSFKREGAMPLRADGTFVPVVGRLRLTLTIYRQVSEPRLCAPANSKQSFMTTTAQRIAFLSHKGSLLLGEQGIALLHEALLGDADSRRVPSDLMTEKRAIILALAKLKIASFKGVSTKFAHVPILEISSAGAIDTTGTMDAGKKWGRDVCFLSATAQS